MSIKKRHYTEIHSAKCHYAHVILLFAALLSVIMLKIVAPVHLFFQSKSKFFKVIFEN
jgi:hypothetical protein